MNEYEMSIFEIIQHAGMGKSYSYEALDALSENRLEDIKECFKKADEEFTKAHEVQTKLIQSEAAGNKHEVTLLMVHAQDQLMSAMESRTLIERIIELHKKEK